jgi:hypothetical protein
MRLDFKVAASNGWATCARFYPSAQDWSAAPGISFYLHVSNAAQIMHVDLYAQAGGERESYFYALETTPQSVSGWVLVQIPWEEFHRVDWEPNAGAPFTKATQVEGLAFGIPSLSSDSEGQIWVDDLTLAGVAPAAEPPVAESTVVVVPAVTQPPASTPAPSARNPLGCAGSTALPLAVLAGLWFGNRKRG